MPRQTIAGAAYQLLAEHRALSAQDLGARVLAAGLTRSSHPTQAVSRALNLDPRFRRLMDGRWIAPGTLLDRTTLTHRLTAGEATTGVLALFPDLDPLRALAQVGILSADGQVLTYLWDDDARERTGTDTDAGLEGPPGWFAGAAGDLLHIRLTGSLLRVASGHEPAAASRVTVRRIVETVRSQLATMNEVASDYLPPVVSLGTVLLDMLVTDPGLLEHALPPLGDALLGAGLELRHGYVGLPGTDWESVEEMLAYEADDDADLDDDETALAQMAEAFDLEPVEVEGVRIVLGALELSQRLDASEGSTLHATVAPMFAAPGIARVLAAHAWTDPTFEPFVAAVAAAARGRDAAGPQFVLAACAEARHDALEAEYHFRAALEADPGHELARIELARYEADRGNYAEALGHLRAAHLPTTDVERAWLEALVGPAFSDVGRNAPCPCGSGRKYKVCHLGKPGPVSDVSPTVALLHKVAIWLTQPDESHLFSDLQAQVAADGPDQDPDEADADPLAEPMFVDVLLFDRGALERFLDVRGVLLPEPERALGRQWLGTRRSLYEVQAVRPGAGLTLRDMVTEDVVELGDRSLSRQVQRLDVLCLHLMPDGAGGITASDGVSVPRLQRQYVLDLITSGDGLGLLRWIAHPNPPLQVRNMDGEELLFVKATYKLPDAAAAATALRRTLRDDGDGRFVETVERHGQDWTRGSITLKGDRATVEANSAERATSLERTLKRAAPGSRLVRREERDMDEAAADGRAAGPVAAPIDVSAHPELAKAMDQMMRDFEANWVDEQIPALGGSTPRQAVTDPKTRPKLDALLDDMEWELRRAGGTGLMDPARIRALLGLTGRAR